MQDQDRGLDGADAQVRAELVVHQPPHRHDGKHPCGHIRRRREGSFQDELGDRPCRRERDRDARPERMPPQNDTVRRIAGYREPVGGLGIAQQSVLSRAAGRAHIAAIGQRDEASAGGDQFAMPGDLRGHDLGIAVEIDHDRLLGTRRHVPRDHPLAVTGGEHDLLGLRQARRRGRDMRRPRQIKQKALAEIERGDDGDVAAQAQQYDPFQHVHGAGVTFRTRRRPRASPRRPFAGGIASCRPPRWPRCGLRSPNRRAR